MKASLVFHLEFCIWFVAHKLTTDQGAFAQLVALKPGSLPELSADCQANNTASEGI